MFINLTSHSIDVYNVDQFINLKQLNPTTWVADSVDGDAILSLPSQGNARIDVTTDFYLSIDGINIYTSFYGDINITGFDISTIAVDDLLIVSLPVVSNAKLSNHPLSSQLVSPFQVVRKADNTSAILGCTGFTK